MKGKNKDIGNGAEKKTRLDKKLAIPLAAMALVLSAGGGIVAAAHADSSTTTAQTVSTTQNQNGPRGERPAAVGTVTAVSGSTITLTDKQNNMTYTVDASSATIEKHTKPTTQGQAPTKTTITVSDIGVGDTLMVRGTVNGTSITAIAIEDGDMPFGHGGPGGYRGVHGTVTAVNGTTLTVQGQNGTTYTVDASGADATKMQTILVSDITVGDSVGIDGTMSGTSVTAKHVMDGLKAPTQNPQ